MKKYCLSLIIPAYNEEKKIEKDIREAFKYFKKKKITGEVIVSTDGVSDNTNKIVRSVKGEFPNLILLTRKEKIGKGAAIKRAVVKASGRYIMFADAGLCVPFKFIDEGVKKLTEGYDLAFGSREGRLAMIKKEQPLYRKIGSRVFGFLIRRGIIDSFYLENYSSQLLPLNKLDEL